MCDTNTIQSNYRKRHPLKPGLVSKNVSLLKKQTNKKTKTYPWASILNHKIASTKSQHRRYKVRSLYICLAIYDKHTKTNFLPGLPPAATKLCWQVTARCLCWWLSGQRDRPFGATCSGTSCRLYVHSLSWWACEQFPQMSVCRSGTAGTLSIVVLALAWLYVDGMGVYKCMSA